MPVARQELAQFNRRERHNDGDVHVTRDEANRRAHALELASRIGGPSHELVLKAARAYYSFLDGDDDVRTALDAALAGVGQGQAASTFGWHQVAQTAARAIKAPAKKASPRAKTKN